MKHRISSLALAALTLLGATVVSTSIGAQVAGGTTTIDATVTETTSLAMGWSVKKTLMGKSIYNEKGSSIGKVDDLIISPERNLTYVIVGAGGFVGIGRHDVAIPVNQIKDQDGKLVMAGASKESIKAMPEFSYATDTAKRDQFVAAAEKDIAKGKAMVSDLEQKAGTAAADTKTRIGLQLKDLEAEIKTTEIKLAEMKKATAVRWKEFEAGVTEATARLRKSIQRAVA